MTPEICHRLAKIKARLNEIWFNGNGPAGGDILLRDKREFDELLEEESNIRSKTSLREKK